MPLPIPNLDDRTFDQLVDEAKALIPKHFPAWTDHNFSDPGITFLELFAFLIENAIYQVNRVPERSLEHFASLLGVARSPGERIETLFGRVRKKLDSRERAVTLDEIEQQILLQPAETWPAKQKIARAEVLVDLQAVPGVFPAEARLKVMIVPVPEATEVGDIAPEPSDKLCQAVYEFLRERVPICTRLQVMCPQYSAVHLEATVVRGVRSRLDQTTVRQNVVNAVRDFLHPTRGGDDGSGWPFGRSIFRSELYAVIEGLPGVDHVRELLLRKAQMRLVKKVSGKQVYPYSSATPQVPPVKEEDNEENARVRSELLLRDSHFPHARPIVEWKDDPFKARVAGQEVELKETLVVNVVDQ